MNILRSQRGFSAVELLVTIGIMGFVLAALYNVLISQQRTYEAQKDVSVTQRDIRASLSYLERDVRMAGLAVPRGTNPIAAFQNGTGLNPAAPDTISINFSPGPMSYLTASTVDLPGTDNIIRVDSVTGFTVGDTINIINNETNNLVGEYVVKAVDSADNKLSLDSDPLSDDVLDIGFLVARDFKTITYSVQADAGTGRNRLIRSDGTVNSTIIDGITNFQISYVLDNGSEVNAPTDLSDVRRVRIDVTAATIKQAARLGGQPTSREITTLVPVKNIRL
ncbi:MAG: prepilin-type N-terminal cleavage/methylation domain-containing protein [Nitrospirae bacterium]|nr:prepilin-type N-terminal cleavage/methylation domain-containing protein [Nitrospirota bacterium]